MAKKHENDEFLIITLKHVLGLKISVNGPRIRKLWAISHENGHKTQKRRDANHISQICNESYESCKSAWNPKNTGNNSWKRPKKMKTTSFWL